MVFLVVVNQNYHCEGSTQKVFPFIFFLFSPDSSDFKLKMLNYKLSMIVYANYLQKFTFISSAACEPCLMAF